MSFLFIQYLKLKNLTLNPAQFLVVGFIFLIAIGTCLLKLPQATHDQVAWIDAWFMATSAVCVTGLSVINAGYDLTIFGQMVLLGLIQVGGLGFMTFSTIMMLVARKKLGFKEKILIKESLNQLSVDGVVELVKKILVLTLAIEVIGGVVLAFFWWPQYNEQALYLGIWHAISAFCNAGFDLFGGNSLVDQKTSTTAMFVVIGALIVLGSLGFSVIDELINWVKIRKLSFHTKVVLGMSLILIILGTISLIVIEKNNHHTLGNASLVDTITRSTFQSISLRTAGFSSIDLAKIETASGLMMILLMFIGASPASMGGGIKTTTALVLLVTIWTFLRDQKQVILLKRTITESTVRKAMTVAIVGILMIFCSSMLILYFDHNQFLPVLFETTSAFATVGLSMGITSDLSQTGKVVLILSMFAGRVGLLTIMFALIKQKKTNLLEYPKAKILIG